LSKSCIARLAVAIGTATANFAADAPDVALWQQVLTQHVSDTGRVNYRAIHDDIGALEKYVQQLAAVSPDSHPALFPSREAKFAYWLNAYNAIVVWAFAKEYPDGRTRLRNVLGQANFFFRRKFTVGGVARSLDDIETNSVRKAFGDPRIHFYLVCASESCPWLSRTAVTAQNLDRELEERTRLFLSQPRNVTADVAGRSLRLSKIFDWYEKDFGGRAALLRFLAARRPEIDPTRPWRISYPPYDWSLNEPKQ
jgi:hypothetical protein